MPSSRTTTSLNRLTSVAATLFEAPGATVVLVGADGLTLSGNTNVCRDEAPRKASFTDAAVAMGPGAVLVVENAAEDERFRDAEPVCGPNHIRFYAGAVISLKDGTPAGAICVLDIFPRERPGDDKLEALKRLAEMAADILDNDAEIGRQREELAMIKLAEAMSSVGHWRMDFVTREVTWSDAVYRIYGLDRETFIPTADSVIAAFHPDDQEEVRNQLRQVAVNGGEVQSEPRLVRPDGEIRRVQSRATAEFGLDGKAKTLFGVVRDVTEERGAMDLIRRSEARYRLLADNTADVITRIRRDGSSKYISPAVETLLGWRSEEMTGQIRDYIHPDDIDDVVGAMVGSMAAPERKAVIHRARHKAGHYVWVESSFQRIPTQPGQAEEAVVVIRDIAQRKALEDQLQAALDQARESEARYRLLTDRSEDVIATYGYDMKVTYVSPAVEKITGIPPEEILGTPVTRLIHPEDVSETIERLATFIRENPDKDIFSQTYRAFTRDGDTRHFETRTRIVRDDKGRVKEIQDVVRDVTETRRLEEELREALMEAEAAGQAKAEFLANMSHELRTPLTSVVGFAGLLKGSQHLSVEDRRHVDRIATGSEVLLSVINDILDYSKLEAEALEVDPQPFHVWDFAHGAGDLMEAQRAAKGLDLKIDIAASVPEILRGDAGRLRQVTLNFLSNAMKFTTRGDVRLDLSGRTDEAGTWWLKVAVTDTGIGIVPEKLDTLFERFTQADQSTTRNFGGTGLGLAISKRLVEAMGGQIGVTSEPGVGSTFWFEVPLSEADAAPSAPVETVVTSERRARILVADDAPANRELVGAILGQLGIQTEVAGNGFEALAAVQVADYDLVLMDMHMPEMDGLEATRSIRALGGDFVRLPIIALTANVQREQIQTCLDAGMDGHVGKPINIAELAAAVAHWLEPTARDAPSEGVVVA
ncbi:MAG: PAS domain S-box protein [Caulobacterales bacterium]|nr:PAS domain S-box protein [Caulobacterales bacterium]